jgi:predicted nucleotidyltransferase
VDLSQPYKAVCPSLDGEVLNVLAATTRGLTGREVALLSGRSSHSGVLAVLNRLTEHGLVTRVELSRAFLFALNRDHLAAPAVEQLIGLKARLLELIRKTLDTWRIPPVHASLFGSAARGDGDTSSDIDLFVVRRGAVPAEDTHWREQLDALEQEIFRWTGNRASVSETSEDEIERLAADNRQIVAELRADAIVLVGLAITAMLGEA